MVDHEKASSLVKAVTGCELAHLLASSFDANPVATRIIEAQDGSELNPYHTRRLCAGWIHELFLDRIQNFSNVYDIGICIRSLSHQVETGESVVGWIISESPNLCDTTSVYFIKGCFDMYELGAVVSHTHKTATDIIHRHVYISSLNAGVLPVIASLLERLTHIGGSFNPSRLVLFMDLPLWHNIGHAAWNGLNGLYKYRKNGVASILDRVNCMKPVLSIDRRSNYFDIKSIAKSHNWDYVYAGSEQRSGAVEESSPDSLIFPIDTMHHYGGVFSWLDQAWTGHGRGESEIVYGVGKSPNKSYYILGIKGSDKQIPRDMQVKFTTAVARRLLEHHNGECEIGIDGCSSPSGYNSSMIKNNTRLHEFVKNEADMFKRICKSLVYSSAYMPRCLIGLEAKSKHSDYRVAKSASFFDGSCATQAVLESLPFQMVLYCNQPYSFGTSRESGMQRWGRHDIPKEIINFPQVMLTRDEREIFSCAVAASAENLLSLQSTRL